MISDLIADACLGFVSETLCQQILIGFKATVRDLLPPIAVGTSLIIAAVGTFPFSIILHVCGCSKARFGLVEKQSC